MTQEIFAQAQHWTGTCLADGEGGSFLAHVWPGDVPAFVPQASTSQGDEILPHQL